MSLKHSCPLLYALSIHHNIAKGFAAKSTVLIAQHKAGIERSVALARARHCQQDFTKTWLWQLFCLHGLRMYKAVVA